MAKGPKVYERLSRTRRQLGGFASLWLASDHILQVQSTGYSERYQRFYLRDIKGLFIIESNRRMISAIILPFIGLAIALPFAIAAKSIGVGAAITGGFCAIFLPWNHLLGAGCKVFLATGVQTVQLESLVRRRYAHKIVDRIIPIVEAAQVGIVPPEPLAPESSAQPPLPAL